MIRISTLKVLTFLVSFLFIGTNNILAEDDKPVQITIPSTGHLAFVPERNFTGPAGIIVSNFTGSSNTTSPGLSFNNQELDEGIVIAHTAGSTTPLILTARPGVYTLTYTDQSATKQYFTTSAYWTEEAIATTTINGRRVYKFVNTTERVGFVRDETYALTNYASCGMNEGEHLYTALATTALDRIAATLETITDALSFIPWSEKFKCPMVETAGITDVITKANTSEVIYNLQGVRLSKPQRGLNIVNGKKVLLP